MKRRAGQGQLLAILLIALAIGAFAYFAGESLLRRRKAGTQEIRKLQVQMIRRRLEQALLSPVFLNERVIGANSGLLAALQSPLAPKTFPDMSIPNPVGDLWLGAGAGHTSSLADGCIGQRCAFRSRVDGAVVGGRLVLSVTFRATEFETSPFNPANPDNLIVATVAADRFAVRVWQRRVFCRTGHKLRLLAGAGPETLECPVE